MTKYLGESGGSREVFLQHPGNVEAYFRGIKEFHEKGISSRCLQLLTWSGICVESELEELDSSLLRQYLLHPGPAVDSSHTRGEEGKTGLQA